MFRIKSLNASELVEFTQTAEFRKLPHWPVSPQRALSYLASPRSRENDIVCLLGYLDNELIAYRCIMPDRPGKDREGPAMGWLSGNWVRPDKRRSGYATGLFREALKHWEGRLIFTNYAPESKAVYDKTGEFKLYHRQFGSRTYLRFDLATLLPPKSMILRLLKPVWWLSDLILNFFHDIGILVIRPFFNLSRYRVIWLSSFDREAMDFARPYMKDSFSGRDEKDINWILHYPWIVEQPVASDLSRKYFFSAAKKRFANYLMKVYKENELKAVLWLTRVDRKLTMPYGFFPADFAPEVDDIIYSIMLHQRLNIFTTFHRDLASAMARFRWRYLFRKNMVRNYYATKKLIEELPDPPSVRIYDGDGDVAFV